MKKISDLILSQKLRDEERKEEHEQEEREIRADEGFRQFKEDNLNDLNDEFCKARGNISEDDKFDEFCRSEFKRWGER